MVSKEKVVSSTLRIVGQVWVDLRYIDTSEKQPGTPIPTPTLHSRPQRPHLPCMYVHLTFNPVYTFIDIVVHSRIFQEYPSYIELRLSSGERRLRTFTRKTPSSILSSSICNSCPVKALPKNVSREKKKKKKARLEAGAVSLLRPTKYQPLHASRISCAFPLNAFEPRSRVFSGRR